jgi:hypothetical protein
MAAPAQLSPGAATRRSAQKLTVIPEGEREVKYRFDFILCGKGANNFCLNVISSDLAQEFLSKVRQDEKRDNQLESLAEDEEDEPAAQVRSTSKTDPKKSTSGSLGADERIMFLPVGENASSIARLRFQTLEKFSDSLQQPKDRPQALSTVVALLCTKPAGRSHEEAAKSAILEWQSRLAELSFMKARLRPYTITLTYGLDEDAEKAVIECINKTKVKVTPIFQEDEDIENVVESLQSAIDKAVANSNQMRRTASLLSRQDSSAEGQKKGWCCSQ